MLWIANDMTMPAGADHSMPGMPGMADMPGMNRAAPSLMPWTASEFALTFVMWTVMMVGMMTPSTAPMVLIYARVARQADLQGAPLAATGWFLSGYFLAWTGFSLVATLVQGGLQYAALLTPGMQISADRIGGAVLIVAGVYQWTPFKDSCLSLCRSPLAFIQDHGGFRKTAGGSVALGARHGLYCIGCCWSLMSLLFVGGVMSIVWIAAISALVLVEKATPKGRLIARLAGASFVFAGIRLIARV